MNKSISIAFFGWATNTHLRLVALGAAANESCLINTT